MPKPFLYILVALPLLIAALALGRTPAPRGCEPRAQTTTRTRSTVHVRVAQHAPSHARTTIDDDDEYDDDDEVESAMLAPRQHPRSDVASDPTTSDDRAMGADRLASVTTAASLRMTGRAIRPSREHRSAADRPPRS